MRRLTRLALAAVALGVLAGAQGQDRPEVQLKAAIYKETVEADLQGAIALYKQIVSNGAAARPVAAAALLSLGGCYEKLGQRDARAVYERLVAEYPDQAQEATQARDRLAAMSRAAPASSREPLFRKVVMTGLGYTDAQLSPDGEAIAFTDSGAVWVVPVATRTDPVRTGIPAKLTGSLDAHGLGWSPDGRSIAFNTPTGISLIPRSGGRADGGDQGPGRDQRQTPAHNRRVERRDQTGLHPWRVARGIASVSGRNRGRDPGRAAGRGGQ